MRTFVKFGTVALLLALVVLPMHANTVGQWSGSGRTWNSSEFSIIKSTMTAAGNVVTPDEAINAGNLAAAQSFLIGEPGSAPNAGEMTLLQTWLNGGGILLVMGDSAGSGAAANNTLLSFLGVGISYGPNGGILNSPTLSGGVFASEGPPYNIVGQTLATTPATEVLGGNVLAGDYIHWAQLGLGYVFVFGDRSDHDFFNPTNADVNGQLFLNIVGGGAANPVPEPASMVLVGSAAMGLLRKLRRK